MLDNNRSNSKDDYINHRDKDKKAGKRMPVWMLVLTDLIVTCICLSIFLLYHYVLPRHLSAEEVVVATVNTGEDTSFVLPGKESTEETEPGNYEDDDIVDSGNEDASDTDADTETEGAFDTSETTKDTTAQPIKGVDANGNITNYGNSDTMVIEADKTVIDDFSSKYKKVTQVNSYLNDNIQFTTNKVEAGSGVDKITYYVSDIYVTNIKYLKTAFATGEYGKNLRESTLAQAKENKALLAINGDYYGNSEKGLVIRNGVLYRSETYDADICVLYTDGTMKTYAPEEFNLNETVEQGAWQAWIFGPQLLDGKGNILSSFNSTYYLSQEHPRTAIGYVEPGHYVFVVVDGRNEGYSRGASLNELAQIMVDAGCVYAYNLDGGKSSEMVYKDEFVNQPCEGGRAVSDIIYIGE